MSMEGGHAGWWRNTGGGGGEYGRGACGVVEKQVRQAGDRANLNTGGGDGG